MVEFVIDLLLYPLIWFRSACHGIVYLFKRTMTPLLVQSFQKNKNDKCLAIWIVGDVAKARFTPMIYKSVKDYTTASMRLSYPFYLLPFASFFGFSKYHTMNVLFFDGLNISKEEGTKVADFIWTNSARSQLSQNPPLRTPFFNHLSNSQVFENKYFLAMVDKTIKSFAVNGKSEVIKWCSEILDPNNEEYCNKVWVLKDGLGNSGTGIWFITMDNWKEVVYAQLPEDTESRNSSKVISNGESAIEDQKQSKAIASSIKKKNIQYAIQEYVENIPLWNQRKFHLRVYGVLRGDLSCYLHRLAFLHPANKPFKAANASSGESAIKNDGPITFDPEMHITNQCTNVGNEDLFAGEQCIDLTSPEYKTIHSSIKEAWSNLIESAKPFLKYQRSPDHFEYIGIDVLPDVNGGVHIVELNCPPGQTSSRGDQIAEEWHNQLIYDLFNAFIYRPFADKSNDGHADNNCVDFYTKKSFEKYGWELAKQPSKEGVDVEYTEDSSTLSKNALTLALYANRKGKWRGKAKDN